MFLGGGGKGSGISTIINFHYKSYEGGLKNGLSVIVPTNFGEGFEINEFIVLDRARVVCLVLKTYLGRVIHFV